MQRNDWKPEDLKDLEQFNRKPVTTETGLETFTEAGVIEGGVTKVVWPSPSKAEAVRDLKELKPVPIYNTELYEALSELEQDMYEEEKAAKVAKFGTGEEAEEVSIRDLEPGVRVDGDPFGFSNTVTVQEIYRSDETKIWKVVVAEWESGRVKEQFLNSERKIQSWGFL